MSETFPRRDGFGWLLKNFGVDFSTLDKETQDLVSEIGQVGVEQLVKSGAQISHRGTTDLINLEERLLRIQETGGLDRWRSQGAKKVKGDKPSAWILQELIEVANKLIDGS